MPGVREWKPEIQTKMTLRRLKRQWDALGKRDPLWAVIADPQRRGGRWDLEEFFDTGVGEIDGLMGYLASLGLEVSRGRALDFGCGVGRLTQGLAAHFAEADGVDIAPSMIHLAVTHNRYGQRCRYHLNQRPNLGLFDDDTFDLVYSNLTLQHIEPRYSRAYIGEFLRILVPGGALVFQLPACPGPTTSRTKQLLKAVLPRPIVDLYRRVRWSLPAMGRPRLEMHWIPKGEVIDLLERHGGKVIDVQPDELAAPLTGFRYCVTKGNG
jgi:SAM-dependent methyltransferase